MCQPSRSGRTEATFLPSNFQAVMQTTPYHPLFSNLHSRPPNHLMPRPQPFVFTLCTSPSNDRKSLTESLQLQVNSSPLLPPACASHQRLQMKRRDGRWRSCFTLTTKKIRPGCERIHTQPRSGGNVWMLSRPYLLYSQRSGLSQRTQEVFLGTSHKSDGPVDPSIPQRGRLEQIHARARICGGGMC